MASREKNLSQFNLEQTPDLKEVRIGIIVSEWNSEITEALFEGCFDTLKKLGAKKKNIHHINVPGSFELPVAAKMLAESKKMDAVICLGCVIQGETRHFEFICSAVAQGIMDLNVRYNIPFVFGVLTCDSLEQARDRSGGKYGNKGIEAAITSVKMMIIKNSLRK
jgi:6,7-dimethyl-8-ribityllumazine synthase